MGNCCCLVGGRKHQRTHGSGSGGGGRDAYQRAGGHKQQQLHCKKKKNLNYYVDYVGDYDYGLDESHASSSAHRVASLSRHTVTTPQNFGNGSSGKKRKSNNKKSAPSCSINSGAKDNGELLNTIFKGEPYKQLINHQQTPSEFGSRRGADNSQVLCHLNCQSRGSAQTNITMLSNNVNKVTRFVVDHSISNEKQELLQSSLAKSQLSTDSGLITATPKLYSSSATAAASSPQKINPSYLANLLSLSSNKSPLAENSKEADQKQPLISKEAESSSEASASVSSGNAHLDELADQFHLTSELNTASVGFVTPQCKGIFRNHLLRTRKRDDHLNKSLNDTDICKSKLSFLLNNGQLNTNEKEQQERQQTQSKEPCTSNSNNGNGLNWKSYRSLQKSKKSIKTIEETIKNSRSIEQWLNDLGKIQFSCENLNTLAAATPLVTASDRQAIGAGEQPSAIEELDDENQSLPLKYQRALSEETLTKSERASVKELRLTRDDGDLSSQVDYINDDMDECADSDSESSSSENGNEYRQVEQDGVTDDDGVALRHFLHDIRQQYHHDHHHQQQSQQQQSMSAEAKLTRVFDSIAALTRLNSCKRAALLEAKMRRLLAQFLLPKSQANVDDIDYLRWLLENACVRVERPFITRTLYSLDRLNAFNVADYNFLLYADKLNIRLSSADELEQNEVRIDVERGDFIENNPNGDVDEQEDDENEQCWMNKQKAEQAAYIVFELSQESLVGDEMPVGRLRIDHKRIKKILEFEKKLVDKCARLTRNKSDNSAVSLNLIYRL
jgi:hypothetical protein